MSLLTVDITKKRRLSLKEVKLPAPESYSRNSDNGNTQVVILSEDCRNADIQQRSKNTNADNQVDRTPTAEEITYSKFIAISPAIENMVESLGLVSSQTGERIRKIDLSDLNRATIEPPKTATVEKVKDEPKEPAKSNKIEDITKRIIAKNSSLDKEALIAGIMDETKVNRERAEAGFNLMLSSGVVTETNVGTYYLTGSTPF